MFHRHPRVQPHAGIVGNREGRYIMCDSAHPILTWKYSSSEKTGFHPVTTPENSTLTTTWVYRLNLAKGERHEVFSRTLEMNGIVISGAVDVEHETDTIPLQRLDSFYMPGNERVTVIAREDAFLYIGGAPCEGVGTFFTRKYDADLELGDIRQVHGEPPYRRDVFMTINQEVPGSRLICGVTWGEDGKWTSWPPHQHTEHLEEVYCYFDIPKPRFALHLGYTDPGEPFAAIPVSTGDCVIAPEGYHPTVGSPGVQSCYFWVMAAHSKASRRYDLAVNDPAIVPGDQ